MRGRPRQAQGCVGVIARVCQALLLVIAILAALGATLGLAGRWSDKLDLFAHLAVAYVVVSLVTAAVAVLRARLFRRATLIASAVGLVASAALIVPELTRSTGPEAAPGAPGTLKVIQFNALRTNTDIARAADWLIAQDADVIAISEARHDLRDLLLKRAGWRTAGAHGSLIIFTRDQYARMTRPSLPPRSQLTFVNATYARSDGAVEVVTAHLDWPTRPTFRLQPQDLESVIARLPQRRMVLLGDFNATPWSQLLRRLDRSLDLIRRDRAVPTFPAQVMGRRWPLPFLPIDHVYAGPGWATVKVERGPWLGSDHYPLIVTLAPVPD